MLASLRARLLAAVLILSAVGLLLLAAITYAEQRSFLLDRVDQQARSAPPAVAAALGGDNGYGPAGGDRDHDRRGGPGGGPALLPIGTYREQPNAARKTRRGALLFHHRQSRGGRGGGPPRLPTGTYGEQRNAAGKPAGAAIVFNYGQSSVTADPDLPKDVPIGEAFTVDGENGDSNHYRVLAQRDPFATTTTI